MSILIISFTPFSQIEKDKKSTFAELQTAIAAICATLKREYEIEIRLGTTVDKVVDKALAECIKAKAALHKRSMETVIKNMNKINEIYTGMFYHYLPKGYS